MLASSTIQEMTVGFASEKKNQDNEKLMILLYPNNEVLGA